MVIPPPSVFQAVFHPPRRNPTGVAIVVIVVVIIIVHVIIKFGWLGSEWRPLWIDRGDGGVQFRRRGAVAVRENRRRRRTATVIRRRASTFDVATSGATSIHDAALEEGVVVPGGVFLLRQLAFSFLGRLLFLLSRRSCR